MKDDKILQYELMSEEELEQVAAIVWHQSYDGLIGPQQVEYMLARFQNREAFSRQMAEGYVYRGLFADGKLTGYTGSVRENDDRVFLSKLYILQEYRKHGFGRKLIEDVKNTHEGCKNIYLTVNKHNPSFEMYRHMGFRVIDSVVTDIGEGYVMDDYIMQLDVEE